MLAETCRNGSPVLFFPFKARGVVEARGETETHTLSFKSLKNKTDFREFYANVPVFKVA
jgi:hypothetical protein